MRKTRTRRCCSVRFLYASVSLAGPPTRRLAGASRRSPSSSRLRMRASGRSPRCSPAPGLKVELFAAEPLLANPVATQLRQPGPLLRRRDLAVRARRHRHPRPHGLARRRPGLPDRRRPHRAGPRKMGPNARTFAKYPDVVRLIEDTNGDGKADKSTVFAEVQRARRRHRRGRARSARAMSTSPTSPTSGC